jgi:hypothetical protein
VHRGFGRKEKNDISGTKSKAGRKNSWNEEGQMKGCSWEE